MSEALHLPTSETLSAPQEQIALQGRLLVGTDEFLDPEKSDLRPVTVQDFQDRTNRESTTYTYLTHASINERQQSWEGKNGNNFDNQKNEWIQHTQTSIQNAKDFFEKSTDGARWTTLFGKLGLDTHNVTPDQINVFYEQYCGRDASSAKINQFVNDILNVYKVGDTVNLEELSKDKSAIRWLAMTMGKKTAEIVEELIMGEAQVMTAPEKLVEKVNGDTGGVLVLNKLSQNEKDLLTFLKEGRTLSGKKEPAVQVPPPVVTPPPQVPISTPPPVVPPPASSPDVVQTPPVVAEPIPSVVPPKNPEELAQKVEEVKREIFEKAGTRTAAEMLTLIDQVSEIQKQQWENGSGKLKGTIPETAQAVGKEIVYDGDIVFLPKTEGQLVVVGDIHGDFATVQHVIDKAQFIENMEQGDKTKTLVFMGDLVDRGGKDVEVVEAVLELKRRYPDNVIVMKADHEILFGVSSHDFPKRVASHYYPGGAEENNPLFSPVHAQVNEKVFNILPRLVVCENGVVLAHGGPPAHKLNLEGLRGQHKIFDQEIVWADPADPKRIQELEQKDAEFRSVELPNLKKRLQDAIDKSLPNIYYEKKNQPIAQVQDAIRLFETRPEGIWFNTTRVEDEIFYEAIVKGMTQYSEKGLRKFLDEIGGNVMIRGHQTSVEVDGGAPNPFLSNILWTIHTSGQGSPESYYDDREPDPRYAIFDKNQDVTNIDPDKHTVKVWA